ncbi:DUF1003 domain-containing protein [Microbacterium capsulatum]|uniref:DUF1003 domain-containing protein n=1 Tax=Microbacterium capsulatum TaxID=3041921 RepID=A0ABU0XE75_9MICO|nr:DUF1003 domain-containing protein [Microbacterium sp. ASV81]MDQ4213415.1 DUF1003 domain-containing protein [Microbacterium sp. ASV81]
MSSENFTAFLRRLPSGSARPSPESTWHERAKSQLTLGERSADRLRNAMGSWGFVGGFVLFMAAWWMLNTAKTTAWDPYPFILLNLFLSMLAGLQGAILLIAAKRQDAIAAALAQHDFDTNVAAKADIEALLEINRRQLEMIAELQGIAQQLLPPRARDAARAAGTRMAAEKEAEVQEAVTRAADEAGGDHPQAGRPESA